jgi:hypothetical protein
MSSCVCLVRIKIEILLFSVVLKMSTNDQSCESIILEFIHKDLLIAFMSFIIEDQYSSQAIQYPAFLVIIVNVNILVHSIRDDSMDNCFLFQLYTATQSSFYYLLDNLLIIDEDFIVDTDFIEETCCANSLV